MSKTGNSVLHPKDKAGGDPHSRHNHRSAGDCANAAATDLNTCLAVNWHRGVKPPASLGRIHAAFRRFAGFRYQTAQEGLFRGAYACHWPGPIRVLQGAICVYSEWAAFDPTPYLPHIRPGATQFRLSRPRGSSPTCDPTWQKSMTAVPPKPGPSVCKRPQGARPWSWSIKMFCRICGHSTGARVDGPGGPQVHKL